MWTDFGRLESAYDDRINSWLGQSGECLENLLCVSLCSEDETPPIRL
jgi:hypothetical protein